MLFNFKLNLMKSNSPNKSPPPIFISCKFALQNFEIEEDI